MFNRPRCRDWTPLATQQLRLRSLVRIVGHNIVCTSKCELYFTLHFSAMSAPFFTSEKVNPHGTGNVEWAEITCPEILKSTVRAVCIRVWEHEVSDTSFSKEIDSKEPIKTFASNDQMLFIWGVYFSGLVPITKRSDLRFHQNTLAFQMHGGYFVSLDTLTVETLRQQLLLNYEIEQERDTLNVCSCKTNNERTSNKFSNYNNDDNHTNKICNCYASDKATSKKFEINSPRNSRSCSPVRSGCIDSVPSRDILPMLKIRYIEKSFLRSEIRSSYKLESLLKLQEKQRKYKKSNETAKEISEKICMKSAFCLNLELISSKGLYYQQRGNPSMGRTLNRLLFQEPQIKPEDILKAQQFRRKIELARFRCQLLSQEKDRISSNFRDMEKKLSELHDYTIEQESCLMSCYRNLSREKETLLQEKLTSSEKRDLLLHTQRLLRQRRTHLCRELLNVYPITKTESGRFAISNVTLPNTDQIMGENKLINSDFVKESLSPLSLSVALGYVAHVIHMCSIIYNVPLRNPIKYEGSRSRIVDIIKDIPNSAREFPLYSRTCPLPKAVSYAVYLLNQNIAQLNFQVHSIKCDLRETLLNLFRLINGIPPSIPEATDVALKAESSSISGSSVDLHVPVPSIGKSLDIVHRKAGEERLSRSMGSYPDEQDSPEKSFYSSEPILSVQHKVQLSEFNENCNI